MPIKNERECSLDTGLVLEVYAMSVCDYLLSREITFKPYGHQVYK